MNSMSSSIPRNSPYEEDSFIILGSTSPKTSMENAMVESKILENSKGSDLFKMSNSAKSSGSELDDESMLYRAHFNLEQPSPASVEMASAVMLDCHDSSDVQARVVGLIEENTVLRATLKQNNFSMREQFKTIIDWQEDMMKTHQLHKTKFLETKELIEKLRVDNSKLRKELELLRIEKQMTSHNKDNLDAALSRSTHDSQKASSSSGRDSLVDGLTSQLENVERQRKQVIKDNEKLIADKETLEKELKTLQDLNVELKKIGNVAEETEAMNMKLKMELESLKQEKASLVNGQRETKVSESSSNSAENSFVITTGARMSSADLENTIDVLTSQLELIERQRRQVINENDKILLQNKTLSDELAISRQQNEDLKVFVKGIQNERANINQDDLRNLEAKVSNLQVELKNSQVKLMQSENTKLEFTQHKLESQENIKLLTGSIAELKERLREAHTITFQPIRYSLSLEAQCDSSEFSNFVENVRLYDKLLKDLADYLNQHSQQFCSLFDAVTQLLVESLEKAEDNPSQMKAKLTTIKENLDAHHSAIANYNYQVKSALSALEKMFLDYQQVLKILKDHESKTSEHKKLCRESDSLTARMLAQSEQLKDTQKENAALKDIVNTLQKESEERDLLRAQLEIYRCDFEAERDARTQIASEKEEIVSNLQILHRRNQDLTEEVNSFRSRYPHNFGNMTFGRNQSTSASQASSSNSATASAPRVNALNHEVFSCPNCLYKTIEYSLIDAHINKCLRIDN